jgi:hypothetical protein
MKDLSANLRYDKVYEAAKRHSGRDRHAVKQRRNSEDAMLPNMQPFKPFESKKAHIVRVGPLQLFFSFRELVAFQVDGEPVVACAETHGRLTTEAHLLAIEPDKGKWLPRLEFAQKWLKASNMVFRLQVAVT